MDNGLITYLDNNPFDFKRITEDNISAWFDVEDTAFTFGDIVCTSDLYDELINRFGSYENAKKFYELAKTLIDKGQYSQYGESDSIPYLDFTVYLEQEIIDEGVQSPYIEMWEAGKKYHIGDTVYYSIDGSEDKMSCYVLRNGGEIVDEVGNVTYLYDDIEITEDMYNSYVAWNSVNGNIKKNVREENGLYYLSVPYFSGYFDKKTMLTYFDTYDGENIILNHWKESVVTYEANDTVSGLSFSGVTESMLDNVKRKRKDIDEDCKLLPFIYHYVSTLIGRQLDMTCTEMMYMPGFTNISLNEYGFLTSDILMCVEFFADYEMTESLGVFDLSDETIDKPILTNMIDKEQVKIVSFKYCIGGIIEKKNGKWDLIPNSGVIYKENYYISIDEIEAKTPEGTFTFEYFNIGDKLYTDPMNDEGNADLEKSQRDIKFSEIEVSGVQVINERVFNAPYFKREDEIGLQNSLNDINAKIERGKAISFERHNALGEIATMQDLENYKNNFFKI